MIKPDSDSDYDHGFVSAKNVEFIVLPAHAITKHWQNEIGLTNEQVKMPDAFGYCSAFDESEDTVTFRVFVGKTLSKDMRKLAKKCNLTYDRMCRVFFCNMMCLETMGSHNDELSTLSTDNTTRALCTTEEVKIVRDLVYSYIRNNDIDGRSLPRQIQSLLNP